MKVVWHPGDEYPSSSTGKSQLDQEDAQHLPDGSLVWDIPDDDVLLNRKNSKVLQTRILDDHFAKFEILAQVAGVSNAEYLRRIVVNYIKDFT